MPVVVLKLHEFGTMEDATKIADEIRERGEVFYTTPGGDDVAVTIGDVSVDNT